MRKATLIAVGAVAAVASIVVWMMVSTSPETEVVTPETSPEVVETVEVLRPSDRFSDEAESEESEGLLDDGDVTRIIVVEPEGDEISDLLSEKVIRDGKIVDKK